MLYSRVEHVLMGQPRCRGIEVARLDAGRLLEERGLLHIRGIRHELADAAVLQCDVAADGSALEELESVVVDVGDLAERLMLLERLVFLLALQKVHDDELVWNVEFLEDSTDALSAGGYGKAVELEDHVAEVSAMQEYAEVETLLRR